MTSLPSTGLVKILYHGGPAVDPDERDVLAPVGAKDDASGNQDVSTLKTAPSTVRTAHGGRGGYADLYHFHTTDAYR